MKVYRRLAPILLALCFCAIVLSTLDEYGITFDENTYFLAGDSYVDWLRRPSWATIDQFWGRNPEHPPLPKLLGGLAHFVLHEQLGLLNNVVSYRAGILPLVFLLTWALFSFTAELYGHNIALIVTTAFFFLPRVFFHAHLVTLDYPITALSFLVLYTFLKGIRNQRWIWVCAVLLGLALLSKLYGFFLYIPLFFCWLYTFRERLLWRFLHKAKPDRRRVVVAYTRFVPLLVIPPVLFFAGWPWLWSDPPRHFAAYLGYHAQHYAIPVYYLGTRYSAAPWHYPFVLTAVTVPLAVLIPMLIGLVTSALERRRRATHLFVLANALLPILLVAIPGVSKYDGVRLFLPAFPFLCIAAGGAIHRITMLLGRVRFRPLLLGAYALLLLLTIYFSVVRTHPYQSSYYNEAIGGIDGAVRRGFEAEYWGNAYLGLLPWMRQHPEATFWLPLAELEENLYFGFTLYQEDRLLDRPVRFAGREQADYMILLIRQGMLDEAMWERYTGEEPVAAARLSRTILAAIYPLRP